MTNLKSELESSKIYLGLLSIHFAYEREKERAFVFISVLPFDPAVRQRPDQDVRPPYKVLHTNLVARRAGKRKH